MATKLLWSHWIAQGRVSLRVWFGGVPGPLGTESDNLLTKTSFFSSKLQCFERLYYFPSGSKTLRV